MQEKPQRIDRGFIAILMLILVVTMWLLWTPFVPAISWATMRRFHLGSQSFLRWAAQFPIPAMYNFANTYEVRELPPDLFDPVIQESNVYYVNHFPCRVVTFADGRLFFLNEGQDRWFTFTTSYRGWQLESRWHLKCDGHKYVLRRLSVKELSAKEFSAKELSATELGAQESMP